MTQKELSYLVDTLGNEKFLMLKFKETETQLPEDLKPLAEEIFKRHEKMFQCFYSLL